MRFSKKLLAALLPIAATSTLVPVLTSCNNGSAWDFSFGDSINCLDKQPAKDQPAYHTLDEVKNAVKKHVGAVEPEGSIITPSDLPNWYDGEEQKQILYFDFIASYSLLNPKEFKLIWDKTSDLKITYYDADHSEGIIGDHIEYDIEANLEVNIAIKNEGRILGETRTKSYIYQNIHIKP